MEKKWKLCAGHALCFGEAAAAPPHRLPPGSTHGLQAGPGPKVMAASYTSYSTNATAPTAYRLTTE